MCTIGIVGVRICFNYVKLVSSFKNTENEIVMNIRRSCLTQISSRDYTSRLDLTVFKIVPIKVFVATLRDTRVEPVDPKDLYPDPQKSRQRHNMHMRSVCRLSKLDRKVG